MEMDGTTTHALALPATRYELEARRKKMRRRTLNDHVEDAHLELWEVPGYQRLLDAVDDGGTVEGSLVADDYEAAAMIRDWARANGDEYLAGQKKASVVKALKVVLKHYGISRRERAVTVDDEVVPNGGE